MLEASSSQCRGDCFTRHASNTFARRADALTGTGRRQATQTQMTPCGATGQRRPKLATARWARRRVPCHGTLRLRRTIRPQTTPNMGGCATMRKNEQMCKLWPYYKGLWPMTCAWLRISVRNMAAASSATPGRIKCACSLNSWARRSAVGRGTSKRLASMGRRERSGGDAAARSWSWRGPRTGKAVRDRYCHRCADDSANCSLSVGGHFWLALTSLQSAAGMLGAALVMR